MQKKLNLAVIRIDGGTQAREKIEDHLVQKYAENMREGDQFPPIVVFFDGSDHWLGDGFHRYFATKSNGQVSVECDVRPGTKRDAELYSLSANARHGMALSPEDTKRAVRRMLVDPEWGKWTQTEIARHIGCSQMTVSRVKAELKKEGTEPAGPTKKTYTTKSGKEAKMNTSGLGKKTAPKEQKPSEPVELDEETSIQINELSHTITQLEAENQRLKDVIAVGQWDASDIEKIDAQQVIDELREQVRILEIDNKALRDSRDMFQTRNAELMKTVKSLQNKLKKLEA